MFLIINVFNLLNLKAIHIARNSISKTPSEAHTFDMSQAITEGSCATRSKDQTLFFTLLASRASPEISWTTNESRNCKNDKNMKSVAS